jgi:hypothetical protein
MSTADQLSALSGHHTPDVPVGGGHPARLWAADVVTVNPDGTVDVQPISSRASKAQVQTPAWYSPSIGDRVLMSDLGGDHRLPIVIGVLSSGAVRWGATHLAFFGAPDASQPTLTYSRSGAGETTAVAALRQALATVGLVRDNTTA